MKHIFGRTYVFIVMASLVLQVTMALPIPTAVAATQSSVNPCDAQVSNLFHGDLLPLFPAEITGGEYTVNGKTVTSACTPALWTRMIFAGLVWKMLALVNWVAGALAVILTILGGVFYLSGYASDNNVKRAKSVLGATYAGFAIVLLARLIVQGSFLVFSDNNKLIDPVASSPTTTK